jgi:hypothetical protein
LKRFLLTVAGVAGSALAVAPFALATTPTVPTVDVGSYGDQLLSSLGSGITSVLPYAAAITAFAVIVGMIKRWLGHRKATRV